MPDGTMPRSPAETRLPLGERLAGMPALRRTVLLVVLVLIWQLYAAHADNPLMLPSFTDTLAAFCQDLWSGVLIERTAASLRVLLMGYAAGIAAAAVLTALAVSTRAGDDLLATLTAMLNPLPAIALLPLALLWLGLGTPSIVFVTVHSVLWPLALNARAGFAAVSETLRMAGRNVGLGRLRFVVSILVPAAFPAILAGLKMGWAFAWRTLIAAELVFGVSSGNGGLGWYIFEHKNSLETPSVFAGLLTVVLIGLAVEVLVFRTIETHTVRNWGMQR